MPVITLRVSTGLQGSNYRPHTLVIYINRLSRIRIHFQSPKWLLAEKLMAGTMVRETVEPQPPRYPIVLVVEDDASLRMLATDIVEEAGLPVLAAADGEEAVRLLDTYPDIGILFTDINMPGDVDGIALARIARDRHPFMQLLFVSGYMAGDSAALPEGGHFFGKPYDVDQISSTLMKLGRRLQT